jgi:hypothetical protein
VHRLTSDAATRSRWLIGSVRAIQASLEQASSYLPPDVGVPGGPEWDWFLNSFVVQARALTQSDRHPGASTSLFQMLADLQGTKDRASSLGSKDFFALLDLNPADLPDFSYYETFDEERLTCLLRNIDPERHRSFMPSSDSEYSRFLTHPDYSLHRVLARSNRLIGGGTMPPSSMFGTTSGTEYCSKAELDWYLSHFVTWSDVVGVTENLRKAADLLEDYFGHGAALSKQQLHRRIDYRTWGPGRRR